MIMEIWEGRFPSPVDRKQVEDFINNVAKPAREKAGCKMVRWAWTHTGEPMDVLTVIVELDSFADIERVWTVKEMQELAAEWGRRFPNAEGGRTKILEVIE
ncbi:unnamed protein product [marine sediment metagenome]|uniref:ABM domain-containing protein n=1 Tax=marine sediment metagenome TaxID=412755 RepID=X0Z8L2_9ZZZZ